MILLKIFISFLKALNAQASPRALAGGVALGAIIGLTPKGSLHNAVILLVIFLLPVNKSASVVSIVLCSLFSYLGDPLFNRLGEFLLTQPSLHALWTTLANTPVVPWTRFNNTLVMGSLIASVLLFVPIFLATASGVRRYRERIVVFAANWRLFHLIKASKLFALYEKLS